MDLRPATIEALVRQNPNISTWTGRDPPYGSLNAWTISLGFNNLEEPFSDPEIRRAIGYAIDREQLVEIGWHGSGSYTLLPFPDFATMRRFTDPIQDLLRKYETGVYDVRASAEILHRKGGRRDTAGLWSREGKPLKIVVDISSIFQDLAPVLVAQLQRAGFDASFRMTSDSYSRMTQERARAFMMGQSGSVREPHFTLSFYHSRHIRPRAPPPNTSGAGATTSSTLWWTAWDSRRRGRHGCRPCSGKPWTSGSASCRRSPLSSGTTACPTTRPTGQAGRLRPIRTPKAPSGSARGCWSC